jgi:hypothetical protein
MPRFRWAVQADYFARRLTAGDLTGIASRADNEKAWRMHANGWFGCPRRHPLLQSRS